ncbi:Sister chromatid cohesion protein PDS5 homolog A [Coccomyxa sp. Obi]|nr:Sister chromatid cohesion protein PDS5 homolog A [Coccomyxa sp. Obi]
MDKADAYEFDEEDIVSAAKDAGKSLKASLKSKDALLKALKQTGSVLEKAQQTSDEQRKALEDVTEILGRREDVKLRAAFCLCHVLRMHAPETPYEQKALEEVFGLFLQVFRKLDAPKAPSFQLCVSVLDIVSQTKCFLLALDFDTDDLMCDLFQLMLDVISDDNAQSIEAATLHLLSTMLEEGDDVSQRLLDIILGCFVSPKDVDNPAACRCAAQLLRRNEQQLQHPIQRLLIDMMDGNAKDTELADDCQSLLHQIYQVSPSTLLPVMPHIMSDLTAKEDAKRLSALDLLGKLYALPDSNIHSDFPELFKEFVRRSKDQQVEVRQRMLALSAGILFNCASSAAKEQVLEAVVERLMDFEEKVRSSAVAALCEAATKNLQAVGQKALIAASERLRDAKRTVRRDTATQLMSVFRAYSSKVHDAHMVESDEESNKELVIWIPARLLLCASKDADMQQHLIDSVFKNGLFSSKLPAQHAAKQWAAMYMEIDQQERHAVMMALKTRSNFRQLMRNFLDLRAAKAEGAEAKMAQAIHYLASYFPLLAPEKAREHLEKLRDLRDNNIHRSLSTLAGPETSFEEAAKLSKDIVQRIGSRGAPGDFARAVCARLSPQLMSTQHVEELLKLAQEEAPLGGIYLGSALELLVDVAANSPSLFAELAPQVLAMLEDGNSLLADAAARILAHAGRLMQAKAATDPKAVESAERKLLKLSKKGSPKAAKASVRALVAILPESAHTAVLEKLCADLASELEQLDGDIEDHIPSIMQALSSIGRIAPEIFAEHASTVANFVLEVLLPADRIDTESEAEGKVGKVWGLFSDCITVKATALKALARACVPDDWHKVGVPEATADVVDALVTRLARLLQDSSTEMEDLSPCGTADVALMRLAASEALLRLARLHDPSIHPEVYLALSLTMQDQVMEVRTAFGAKVRSMVQLLNKHQAHRASKYAAMLALAGMDPLDSNKVAAYAMLNDFVVLRRRAAAKEVAAAAQASGSGGPMLQNFPEFMLPYIIQILAHHPDFPTRQDLAEMGSEAWEPFTIMLQFLLEPLILASSKQSNAEPPGATLPAIEKVLRTLKATEDATAEPATQNIYMLCDMAMAMAPAIVERHSPGDVVTGKFRCTLLLPKPFFRGIMTGDAKAAAKASYLPEGFEVALVENLCPNQAQPPGQKKGRTGRSKPRAEAKPEKAPAKRSAEQPTEDGGSAKKPARPRRHKGTQASLKDVSSEEEIESSSEEQEDDEGEANTTPAPSRRPTAGGGTADRKQAGSSGKQQAGSSGKRQEGSSGKRQAEEPSDPQSSGGKRQRRDSARYFDALDEEELQEEDEEEGEHPTAARRSPDENAQPENAEAKQRTKAKPAGKRAECEEGKPGRRKGALKSKGPQQSQEGPTDSELHMMSDGDGAEAELASPKVNPPSSSRKQSKASKIAAALQGALAHVTGGSKEKGSSASKEEQPSPQPEKQGRPQSAEAGTTFGRHRRCRSGTQKPTAAGSEAEAEAEEEPVENMPEAEEPATEEEPVPEAASKQQGVSERQAGGKAGGKSRGKSAERPAHVETDPPVRPGRGRKRSDPDSLRAPSSEDEEAPDNDDALRAPTDEDESSPSEDPAPKKRGRPKARAASGAGRRNPRRTAAA